jgi:hypothetical protein
VTLGKLSIAQLYGSLSMHSLLNCIFSIFTSFLVLPASSGADVYFDFFFVRSFFQHINPCLRL